MTNDPEKLLSRAISGQLSKREQDLLAEQLSLGDGSLKGADRYTLLHALGRSGALNHEDTVAHFLTSQRDPMLAKLALQILCSYWGLTEKYLDQVREFLGGVVWDVDNEVRLQAIQIVGEYLRDRSGYASLWKRLLDIFEDASFNNAIRGAAYFAIARAAGKDWKDLPSAARRLDLARGVDDGVMSFARSKCSS